MSGTLFTLPRYIPVNSTGRPYPLSTLTFYLDGTTTLVNVYTTAALSVAHSNPLTSNSAGLFPAIYLNPTTGPVKAVLKNAAGTTLWTEDVIPAEPPLSQASVGAALYPITAAETAAVVTPTSYAYPPLDPRRYGAAVDGSTDDTDAIEAAISVASQTVSSAIGAFVDLPIGTMMVSSMIVLPNRVTLRGSNGRGSVIKATSGHTGPWMFHAVNGTSSMFNSYLRDLHIDCNSVAGLGGVRAQAWQENSGLRNCVIQNFRTSGIRFDDTYYGGASTCKLQDVEFFGSTSGASYGIEIQSVSPAGNFVVTLDNVIVSGGTAALLTAGVYVVTDSLVAIGCHFENCTNGILLDGPGSHTLINCTGSGTGPVVDLVEVATGYTGALSMIGCKRASATNYINNVVTGDVITGAVVDPVMYVYPNASNATVPLFTDADTTPSVKGGNAFRTNNTAPTTITALDNGSPGQIVTILFGDSQTTLSGANFSLRGSFTSVVTGTIKLVLSSDVWYEISRSASTTTYTYTPTNVVADRSYDADATSTAELADVLGTLIADLQARKIIQ